MLKGIQNKRARSQRPFSIADRSNNYSKEKSTEMNKKISFSNHSSQQKHLLKEIFSRYNN